jgi:hypothetical protein
MFIATSIKVLNSVYTEGLAEEAGNLHDFITDHFILKEAAGTTVCLKNKWFKGTDYVKVYFKTVQDFYSLSSFSSDDNRKYTLSEIPKEELWKYDECLELEFEVELHNPMDPSTYIY